MTELIVPAVVALVLIAVAWKVLKGLIKTVALVTIAVLAAIYVFQTGGLG